MTRTILSTRAVARLSDAWISPTPWADAPIGQPHDVIIAAKLRGIGIPLRCISVALVEGAVRDDATFEWQFNGVTLTFPVG